MNNSINNHVSFCGKFAIKKSEISKMPMMKKLKFLKQKDQLVDEFCKSKPFFQEIGDNYIIDIKDSKEEKFSMLMSQLGLITKKI